MAMECCAQTFTIYYSEVIFQALSQALPANVNYHFYSSSSSLKLVIII
jgi:hypothetical protein